MSVVVSAPQEGGQHGDATVFSLQRSKTTDSQMCTDFFSSAPVGRDHIIFHLKELRRHQGVMTERAIEIGHVLKILKSYTTLARFYAFTEQLGYQYRHVSYLIKFSNMPAKWQVVHTPRMH